jgi:hypothetical protein
MRGGWRVENRQPAALHSRLPFPVASRPATSSCSHIHESFWCRNKHPHQSIRRGACAPDAAFARLISLSRGCCAGSGGAQQISSKRSLAQAIDSRRARHVSTSSRLLTAAVTLSRISSCGAAAFARRRRSRDTRTHARCRHLTQ